MNKTFLIHLLLTVVALLLSFTDFYGFGYVIIIVIAALNISLPSVFSTLFSRFIVSTLLLLAVIMMVGLASWFLQITTPPAMVLLAYLALMLALGYGGKFKSFSKTKIFDKKDGLSAGLGLFLPVIVYISYLVPYTNASLYQLVSNGWDNAAHILMLETNSLEKGYVYGKLEEVQHKTINRTNAYPQAWHLATSNFGGGFGKNLFNPQEPFTVLKAYAAVMAIWFFAGIFIVNQVILSLVSKLKKFKMPRWLFVALFVGLSIFMQLLASSGSMLNGFANYLGLLAYVGLFVACALDLKSKKPDNQLSIIMVLAAAAGALCWFLPFPALIISAAILILGSKGSQTTLQFIKRYKVLAVASLIFVAAAIAQITLFVLFTEDSGAELLITDGGVYKVSEILVGLLIIATAVFLHKNSRQDLFNKFLIIICPLLILIIGIYSYQFIMAELLSYYYYKLVVLLGFVTMIFAIPVLLTGFDKLYKQLNKSALLSLLVFPAIIGIGIIISQQNIRPFHFILQANSNISYATAKVITDYLEKEDPNKTKIVIMTDRSKEKPPRNENLTSNLVSNVSHIPHACAYDIFKYNESITIYSALKRLDSCAEQSEHEIIVVTTDRTKRLVEQIDQPNIRIINTY